MSFIRPEAADALHRWREVLVLAALIALGVWLATRPGGPVVPAFGWVMAAGAAALVPVAIRRARFVTGGGGPGVVTLAEGRVTYMGPVFGGAVALDDLVELGIRRDEGGAVWLLFEDRHLLEVPVDAVGADRLFDAFTRLPGLDTARLIAGLRDDRTGPRTLWRRNPRPALTP